MSALRRRQQSNRGCRPIAGGAHQATIAAGPEPQGLGQSVTPHPIFSVACHTTAGAGHGEGGDRISAGAWQRTAVAPRCARGEEQRRVMSNLQRTLGEVARHLSADQRGCLQAGVPVVSGKLRMLFVCAGRRARSKVSGGHVQTRGALLAAWASTPCPPPVWLSSRRMSVLRHTSAPPKRCRPPTAGHPESLPLSSWCAPTRLTAPGGEGAEIRSSSVGGPPQQPVALQLDLLPSNTCSHTKK